MSHEVLILAGGKGQRLLPYTMVLPKPLMPISGVPILEIILRRLKLQGFNGVILAVNHMHRLISTYFGAGEQLGLRIEYNIEDEPLGTCGPISMCIKLLADNFLVMNADVLTTIDLRAMLREHCATGADLTMAIKDEKTAVEFGVVERSADGRVLRINEKPTFTHTINLGIYALRRDAVREYFQAAPHFQNMTDIIESMVEQGKLVRGFECTEPWIDIGRISEYQKAQEFFEQSRAQFFGFDDRAQPKDFVLPQ
jgi:NDP-sugar pyrophosphorylase family protein